jgi:SAM-dependent methyltransferase
MKEMRHNKFREDQRDFYLKRFEQYGDSPQALSWNDKKTQYLRFKNIAELFKYEGGGQFSVHDVGCGLGHFREFLNDYAGLISYSGSDIMEEFIEFDKMKFPDCSFFVENISDDLESISDSIKGLDYYCTNGTFYRKDQKTVEEWESLVFKSMKNMFTMAKKGICVNFLTSYSDFFDDNLYYAAPKNIFNWAVTNCSRFVSICHDIPLYEFFVYIYKEEFIREQFPEKEFSKYFKV